MASPRRSTTQPTTAPALRVFVQLNRAVASRARQGYTAQGICVAISTAAVTAALAVLSGSDLERPDLLGLALLLGTLAFWTWSRANAISDGAVATRVDEDLSLRGAYLAAFEAGKRPAPSVMSELGAERVLKSISRREVLEVATPHTLAFVAMPLIAVALLVVCVGARESSMESGQGERARSFRLTSDLAALARDGAAAMDDATRGELERAAASAASGGTSDRRRDQMREVAERLEALALEAPPGSELAEALAEAAATAESMSLEPGDQDPDAPSERRADTEERGPGEPRGTGEEDGEGPRSADGSEAAAQASRVGPGDLGSTSVDSGGLNPSGLKDRGDAGALTRGVQSEPEDSATRTTLTPRWWDRRDEGLVSRWVALQRGAAAQGGAGAPGSMEVQSEAGAPRGAEASSSSGQ
ncbi:hypothetical protein N9Z54_02375 [Planctomycetota bacterium]|nr:hypothetical protein [Planctomycetota bacterium]